jgi:adenylate kinase
MRNKELLILHGPPGAGKGTQAELYKKTDLHTEVVSMGDLIRGIYLRKLTSKHTDFISNNYYPACEMSDQIANEIIFQDGILAKNGIFHILDGYPQSKIALELLIDSCETNEIKIIGCICLNLTVGVSVKRMTLRGIRDGEFCDERLSRGDFFKRRYDDYMLRYGQIRQSIKNSGIVLQDINGENRISDVQNVFNEIVHNLRKGE